MARKSADMRPEKSARGGRSRSSISAVRPLVRGDLEGKPQCGNLVARMVVLVGELRKAIELLVGLGPLVNGGVEVDEVDAGQPCRGEVDDHVALAIEAARVSHVGVVVGRDVDVVEIRPSDALQVDRYGRPRG